MKKYIIGSTGESAGKTNLIVGLAKAMNKKFGYIKPFGDRLIYRKKRLWDYDAALVTNIFGLKESSEDMTIGFEHSKLRFMYDEEGTKAKLQEMVLRLGGDKEILFIEGGKTLTYGASVRLDTLSLTKHVGGKLLIIVSGDEGKIADDITFIKKYVNVADIDFGGIIINKICNLDDYRNTYLDEISHLGIPVLGVIPQETELTYPTVSYLAERLQARIIAGESGLNKKVKTIFVGAMSGDAAMRLPLFKKENKLAITGGDRSDMILAALESNTAGIILTNNILPPSNIISKASDMDIPLLLVPFNTYETASQLDDIDPLLTKDDSERIELVQKLIAKYVDVQAIV